MSEDALAPEQTREDLLLTLCLLHGGHLWDARGRFWHPQCKFVFDAGWNEESVNSEGHYVRGETWTEACEKYLTWHAVPFDHIV